jgi:hypothetical protein
MIKIDRYQDNDGFIYFEAIINGNQLLTFSFVDMLDQLFTIYGLNFELFTFKAN